MASVPDVYHLWDVLHDDSTADTVWTVLGICQSLLQNPTSMAQPDVERRARVRQRVVDYNAALAKVCAAAIHCRFDDNAVFNTPFVPAEISTRDYFHPSVAGQTRLAAVTYAATFDFTDDTAPVTTVAVGMTPRAALLVALNAMDNVGVAGIEFADRQWRVHALQRAADSRPRPHADLSRRRHQRQRRGFAQPDRAVAPGGLPRVCERPGQTAGPRV